MEVINRQRALIKGRVDNAESLTQKQIADIETIMTLFALYEIEKRLNKEIKEEYISFFKFLFNATYENKILWMRYQRYKLAVKKAKLRCKTEGYKMYVVRNSKTGFKVISSLDFKINQRVRVMKKNVDAKELERIASLVVYPDGTTTGKGYSGKDIDEVTKKEVTNFKPKKKRTLRKTKKR